MWQLQNKVFFSVCIVADVQCLLLSILKTLPNKVKVKYLFLSVYLSVSATHSLPLIHSSARQKLTKFL